MNLKFLKDTIFLKKRRMVLCFLSVLVLFFSGCSLSGKNSGVLGILKSTDRAQSWEAKNVFQGGKSISSVNVLSIAIDPVNTNNIFAGTKENGLYVTRDGADKWEKINYPPTRIYGLAFDKSDSQIIYATGVWQGRGKIYKSENGGSDWKEIYTEPSNGTVVTSLAVSNFDKGVIFAGTSEGSIFKSSNGGESWSNLYKAEGIVSQIIFDSSNPDIIYFVLFKKNILRTKDGGKNFEDLSRKISGENRFNNPSVYCAASDPQNSGVVYVGLDKELIKSSNYGDNWETLNILESSKKFPVRAIAVNPHNANEILYSSAQALYKSTDGGLHWSTFQLETSGIVSIIVYDWQNPEVVYLGLKKE